MYYKPDWYKSKKRMEAFWQQEIVDRCVVSVMAPKTEKDNSYTQLRQGGLKFTTSESLKYWFDPEMILRRNIETMENTHYLGDAIPQIFLDLGAAGHAGFFKNTEYKYLDSAWFFPQNTGEEPEEIEFDPDSYLYKKTIEIAKYLAAESRGRYFISSPDYTGNLDALAHIRGSENLLMDMLTEPDWVHRSKDKIQDAWLKIMEELYPILSPVNEGGELIGWLNTWHRGRHSQMQCDISVMMSPDMYESFTMPELRAQAAFMDASLYHFDGQEQRRHLDALLSLPDLGAIQWTCVAGQPPASEFLPELRRIQAAGKSLVIIPSSPKDFVTLLTELSSKGLQLITYAKDLYEANEILRLAEKHTHE